MSCDYTSKSDYSDYRPSGYPVRHRRKVPFYPMLSLDMGMRRMMTEIRHLDWTLGGFILSEQDYMGLVLDAYASNIHWSTKIEGNRMTLDEVRTLATAFTSGRVDERPNGPKQEILNHLGVLFREEMRIPWSIDTVTGVHASLMEGVGQTIPGGLRDTEVCVRGSDGTEFFIACPPDHVLEELSSLLDWANHSPFGEIVTATLFFHEFESIHPFTDGNGRTGRVLFQSLLGQLGLENCGLCRFEEEMLRDSGTYYDLLAYTDQTGNYTPFVRFVTESVLSAYRDAVRVFSEKDRLRDMDENMRSLARMAKEKGPFTLKEASSHIQLGDVALRRNLDRLVDMGVLAKEGKTRSMRYVFPDPFEDIRRRIGSSLSDADKMPY